MSLCTSQHLLPAQGSFHAPFTPAGLLFFTVALSLLAPAHAAGSSPRMERISVSSTGQEGNAWSRKAAMTPDGRWVVFLSAATNLVATPLPEGRPQWYVRDRLRRTTTLISRSASGAPMTGAFTPVWTDTAGAAISDDGTRIAFDAWAPLVAEDVNGRTDAYLVSHSGNPLLIPTPQPVGGLGRSAMLGADGSLRHLVIHCPPELTTPGAPGQLCVMDRNTQSVQLLTAAALGGPYDGSAFVPVVARTAPAIGLTASASNLVDPPLPPPFLYHAYVRNLESQTTALISRGVGDLPVSGGICGLSSDAQVALLAMVGATVPEPTIPGTGQVFVLDLLTGTQRIVSRGPDGQQASVGADYCGLSGDGRYGVFGSISPELNPFNALWFQYYRFNTQTGAVELLSVNAAGDLATPSAAAIDPVTIRMMSPVLSHDGQVVAFTTGANNLVEGDHNQVDDVYVADYSSGPIGPSITLPATGSWSLVLLWAGLAAITGAMFYRSKQRPA